ncbi:hypothetical protein K458DRAFT_65930 [Lentithecium fluviatile CBS 122367]|uniref:Uncharacterized protein n=1 Tax=Lentithecium fluviatile CBS 122367 TaxID=1168545 RepID=A0A6G1JLI5_9PLEO|nr:hypothetical protein K458DRAFT_65930 [Lentithecium fluviatile CBS 122367]
METCLFIRCSPLVARAVKAARSDDFVACRVTRKSCRRAIGCSHDFISCPPDHCMYYCVVPAPFSCRSLRKPVLQQHLNSTSTPSNCPSDINKMHSDLEQGAPDSCAPIQPKPREHRGRVPCVGSHTASWTPSADAPLVGTVCHFVGRSARAAVSLICEPSMQYQASARCSGSYQEVAKPARPKVGKGSALSHKSASLGRGWNNQGRRRVCSISFVIS